MTGLATEVAGAGSTKPARRAVEVLAQLAEVSRLDLRLTAPFLEHYAVLPLDRDGDLVRVATWIESPDPQALDDLRLILGADLVLEPFPEQELRAAIRRVYGGAAVTAEQVIAALPAVTLSFDGQELALDDLVHLANEAPVIKLVNLLLLEALESRASDVHLEGYTDGLRVRYRVDGVLQDAPSPPAQLTAAVISRLKIMADLDIAERRVPQDGRIRLRLQDRQVDVRVSTIPTLHGESVVLRLLDREGRRGSLTELGMSASDLPRFLAVIGRPHGIVLATGPTGSGKTTTLYAALEQIRSGREKILTVEDPVEYELPGIPQMPVNEKVGVTFATALRALLRQDPDVMLVGEIRDGETAEIATQAALTGHLVLSTLHTNDAPSAITRLIDLGIAPYLVASTVEAVLAQRLVRVLCPHCKEAGPLPAEWHSLFELPGEAIWYGRGCGECRGTGFRGRTGVYELMVLDEVLRQEIGQQRSAGDVRRAAVGRGMRSLRQDGLRLVQEGLTTVEEVLRVTPG
ncbi:MAG: GspE/PulE family protein [Gemmatimonadota bacterium]|nr:GspE/PulE family protein [Gemmatimonadota bacterium]